MTRIVIVDDEQKSREVLKTLLQMFCSPKLEIQEAGTIQEGLLLIRTFNPELVFLDISLREGDSFELLHQLGTFAFEPVFITAYEETAIRTLTYCKVLSLMKPIEIESLQHVFSTALQRKGLGAFHYKQAVFLLTDKPHILPVWTAIGVEHVSVSQIESLQADQEKTVLYLNNGKRILSENNLMELVQLHPHISFKIRK